MVGMALERVASVDMVEAHGTALADAIEAALPGWVERSVKRAVEGAGMTFDEGLARSARDAGHLACADIAPRLRGLLSSDIDDQVSTPLAMVRAGVRYPTEVLLAASVPAPQRDRLQSEMLPDDVYDLAPATFADLGPGVGEVGIAWGAAKAYEHLRRHSPRPGEHAS